MSRLASIRLVAGREIATRSRARSFRISTALVALGLVAVAVFSGGGSSFTTYDIGGVGARATAGAEAARAAAPAFGARVRVHRLAEDSGARREVRAGTIDAAVLAGGAIAVERETSVTVVRLVQSGLARARAAAALRAADVSSADRAAILAPPAAHVVRVGGRRQTGGDAALAFLGALVLYIALLVSGYAVASGVVEEKQSRVVELVVAVMKPADLLTGKIVGIGIVSVGQLLVVAGAGVIAGAAKGTLAVPSGTAVAIALVIVCFVLGHLLYASLYAGAAALVDRQEEQQSAVMPFTSLLIATYVFSNQALAHPRGTFAIVGRVALHAASAFQVILGLVLLAATIPIAIGIAGRLYRGGVLATGGRIKFGTALRNARQGS